jgi:outer membrane protein OmpA-like peptidoglycan-associated protein
MKKTIVSACAAFLALALTSQSASAQDLLIEDNGIFTYHQAPRWRESEEHPLRVAAYIVHPFGWALREGIFRPISYLASSTVFTRSFFGFREPLDFRQPICFEDKVPNCHDVAPLNMIGGRDSEETTPEVVAEEKVLFPDVAFDFNKSELNSLGKARVRQVSQLLSSMPTVKVVVEGHTDFKGSDDFNMKLGSRRADAVIKELSELGIDKSRMSPISFGEARPLFTEQTDWARAANRRVQFSIQGEEPATVASTTTEGLPAATK